MNWIITAETPRGHFDGETERNLLNLASGATIKASTLGQPAFHRLSWTVRGSEEEARDLYNDVRTVAASCDFEASFQLEDADEAEVDFVRALTRDDLEVF